MTDFSGMATVYDILCQDGRTIEDGSFDHQDGEQVPLVFKHNHNDITNFVGYGILRKSDDPKGMRVEATLNNTREGRHALELVKTGVIKHLSIWANDLVEEVVENARSVAGMVHRAVKKGTIREVSLVLAGANPGALIDDVIRHADDPLDPEFIILDGVIIHTDETIEMVEPEEDEEPEDAEDNEDVDSDDIEVVYIDDLTEEDLESFDDDQWDSLFEYLDSEDDEDGSIKHYGVKGMRWGVRKDRSRGGRKRKRKSLREGTILGGSLKDVVKNLTIGGPYQANNRAKLKAAVEKKIASGNKAMKAMAKAVKKVDAAVGVEAGTRNRAALKAKVRKVIAKRQEKGAKAFERDADNLAKAVKKWQPKADAGDVKAQRNVAIWKSYEPVMRQNAKEWRAAAAENRRIAGINEKRAKGIKQSADVTVNSLIHEVSDDDTLTDILKSLTDEQEQLFNIVLHSAATGEKLPPNKASGDDEDGQTVRDIHDTLSEEQKNTLYYLAGSLAEGTLSQEGDTTMKLTHNIFDDNSGDREAALEFKQKAKELIHTARTSRATSLRDIFAASEIQDLAHDGGSVLSHAPAATITNVNYLFPDAKAVKPGGPMFYSRRMEWVENVLGDIRPRPFSRIKSWYADVTADEARAKGYVTGNLKVDEVIEVLKRVTQPQTIYKRQKLDRDDMLDITEFDVVVWLKSEMRMMLREELARAILIGDGRSGASDDKIVETNIRPIHSDADVYCVKKYFNDVGSLEALDTMDFAETVAVMDHIAAAITDYRGSGGPTFYCSPEVASKFLLLRNSDGVRIHKSLSEVAEALRVRNIVEVPVMTGHVQEDLVDPSGIPAGTYDIETIGIVVNLSDYVIGQDRGGETSFFDDFDIDYNQYKYLYETRLSGALVMPSSAIMIGNVTAKTA